MVTSQGDAALSLATLTQPDMESGVTFARSSLSAGSGHWEGGSLGGTSPLPNPLPGCGEWKLLVPRRTEADVHGFAAAAIDVGVSVEPFLMDQRWLGYGESINSLMDEVEPCETSESPRTLEGWEAIALGDVLSVRAAMPAGGMDTPTLGSVVAFLLSFDPTPCRFHSVSRRVARSIVSMEPRRHGRQTSSPFQ